MLIKRSLIGMFLVLSLTSCAKAHHIATVSALGAHAVVAETQDTADRVTCGAPTAPMTCLPVDVRKGAVSNYIKAALKEDIALLEAVRQWPGPPAALSGLAPYLATITDLVNKIIDALPDSPQKARLIALIGGQ